MLAAEPCVQFLQSFQPPGGEGESSPAGRQLLGEGCTDATAGTGDEYAQAVEGAFHENKSPRPADVGRLLGGEVVVAEAR
jgi:hypothetical protein